MGYDIRTASAKDGSGREAQAEASSRPGSAAEHKSVLSNDPRFIPLTELIALQRKARWWRLFLIALLLLLLGGVFAVRLAIWSHHQNHDKPSLSAPAIHLNQ